MPKQCIKLNFITLPIDIENPRGKLICSTRVNETTGLHINGDSNWGVCEEELCPAYKGMYVSYLLTTGSANAVLGTIFGLYPISSQNYV